MLCPEYHIPSQMNKLNIDVVTLSGDKLSLQNDLEKIVKSLEEDGCLVLKNATDLSIFKSSGGDTNYVTKDIVLNQVSAPSSPLPHVLIISPGCQSNPILCS